MIIAVITRKVEVNNENQLEIRTITFIRNFLAINPFINESNVEKITAIKQIVTHSIKEGLIRSQEIDHYLLGLSPLR